MGSSIIGCHFPLRNSINNKIPFYPFIITKDLYILLLILFLFTIQTYFTIASLSHPDNALLFNPLITPLHIVPEWYFLHYYAMLKAIPNKNAGFIIFLTTYILSVTNSLSTLFVIYYFLINISFLWIGPRFPQDYFLSYARILTLHYYLVLIFIL